MQQTGFSDLLRSFIEVYPFQPATAFWRAIEIGHVLSYPFPKGRGLDLGCGDGKLTEIIVKSAGTRELVGVDIDEAETSYASELGIYKSVHTTAGSHINEMDQSFDFAFSNSVLEHIPDLEPVIKEVSRLLKVDGEFLFTVPSDQFHSCLRNLSFGGRRRYLEQLDQRVAHVRYFTPDLWTELLAAAGMRVTRITRYLSKQQVRRWQTLSEMTGGLLYRLMPNKPPIEIQRQLGLRNHSQKTPAALSPLISFMAQVGASRELSVKDDTKPAGGLMILAKKVDSAI